MSGASGTPYARAVLTGLLEAGEPVDVIVSRAARLTILDETGIAFRDNHWAARPGRAGCGREPAELPVLDRHRPRRRAGQRLLPGHRGWSWCRPRPPPWPGSRLGLSKDLLQRAADVTLKERRPLVVVPRETPYARSTLANLLALYDAGATVLPASPAFYAGARDVQQLVDFVAAKVLDVLGVEHSLITRWTGELGAARRDDRTDSAPNGREA